MSQINIHIDPLTTQCVLKNMGLAIDEIKLIRSIHSISQQVGMSNVSQLESGRKRYLISELRFLNKRLTSVREQATIN
jgi:predicted ATP-binding protein involved in virulence